MIKAVIFDMDGVIIDSEPVYQKWLTSFLSFNGINVPEEELKTIPGLSTQAFKIKIESWWRSNGIVGMSGEELNRKYDAYCKKFDISYIDIQMPFVVETVSRLKKEGYRIAIASSSPLNTINKVIDEIGISKFINVKVSGDMFKHSKPNPEIYLHTAQKLGFEPEECLAVEDSTYGIEAAIGAGMNVVAKRDDRFNFNQSEATYHIDSLPEIFRIIQDAHNKTYS